MSSETTYEKYYVPEQSKLPVWMAFGMFATVAGAGGLMNGNSTMWLFLLGSGILAIVMYAWFNIQIRENHQGLPNEQVKKSYVWGMGWFIFSEVMFFAAFFGALFYIRTIVGPWLGGEGAKGVTGDWLYPDHEAVWPLLNNPNNELFPPPSGVINPWHLPLFNTILLIASSVTLTIAHHALEKDKRKPLLIWLVITLVLGFTFLFFQGKEYVEAYTHLDLTLESGIYGTTFFLLTGFHGAHVTIGAFMILIMTLRVMKGHFKPSDHFGFRAAAWYWHFVDVVWVLLFLFVYII